MRLQVLLFTAVIATCKADVPPTEEYPHQADLDSSGNVILYWKFDDTHVTFEVTLIFICYKSILLKWNNLYHERSIFTNLNMTY